MSDSLPLKAPPSPRGSLRNKFIRTMLIVSSIIGGVTLAIVLFLSARSSAQHLRAIEGSIEEGITSKGKVLTENHALALHGMILDNAFLDMQTLLARAVSQDPDLVYGLFVNSDGEALAFQKRGAPGGDQVAPDKDAWRALGLEQKELAAAQGDDPPCLALGPGSGRSRGTRARRRPRGPGHDSLRSLHAPHAPSARASQPPSPSHSSSIPSR